MTLQVSEVRHGSLIIGLCFDFEDTGDVLEWHTHTDPGCTGHITIVAKGEVLHEVRGEENRTLRAGDLINVPREAWHQYTALTPDARLFNFCTELPE